MRMNTPSCVARGKGRGTGGVRCAAQGVRRGGGQPAARAAVPGCRGVGRPASVQIFGRGRGDEAVGFGAGL